MKTVIIILAIVFFATLISYIVVSLINKRKQKREDEQARQDRRDSIQKEYEETRKAIAKEKAKKWYVEGNSKYVGQLRKYGPFDSIEEAYKNESGLLNSHVFRQ